MAEIADIAVDTGLVAGSTGLIVGTGAKVGLSLYGFSTTGIVAGSSAAAAQAAIGNVAAGSTFALLQSIGMVGASALFAPAAIVGGITGAGYLGFRLQRKRKDDCRKKQSQIQKMDTFDFQTIIAQQ